MLCLDAREPDAALAKVDWGLLVFFSALFIVVKGEPSLRLRVDSASGPFRGGCALALMSVLVIVLLGCLVCGEGCPRCVALACNQPV
jgi:hypothetical protein